LKKAILILISAMTLCTVCFCLASCKKDDPEIENDNSTEIESTSKEEVKGDETVDATEILPIKQHIPGEEMRREISTENPMFLLHNMHIHPKYDLQKLIDNIPSDVRPYVVMLLDLSWDIPDHTDEPHFYKLLREELDICAENNIQAMLQISVGSSVFVSIESIEEQYKKHPDIFLGVAFVEQEFGSDYHMGIIADHVELASKYDAYVYWADRDTLLENGTSNFLRAFERNEKLWENSKKYSENFIIGYKGTAFGRFFEAESITAGLWLSGHAGNFACRPDSYSWPGFGNRIPLTGSEYPADIEGNGKLGMFTAPETITTMSILNGASMGVTVYDGPEDAIYHVATDGEFSIAYYNCAYQAWRLIINKQVPIQTKEEVLSRVKIAYVPDEGKIDEYLLEGLYESEPTRHQNWLKKTGRYFFLPILPGILEEYEINSFTNVILQSSEEDVWTGMESKVQYFNGLYPREFGGDMFVLPLKDNKYYVYNSHMSEDIEQTAQIPLKTNTASELRLQFPVYTYGVIDEQTDKITLHLNNYFTDKSDIYSEDYFWYLDTLQNYVLSGYNKSPADSKLRETVITLGGLTEKPTYTLIDEGKHKPSTVSETYENNIYTITVSHNGPVTVTVNCKGNGETAAVDEEIPGIEVIRNPKLRIEGESYDGKEDVMFGVAWDPQGLCAKSPNGGWTMYKNLNFSEGITKIKLRVNCQEGSVLEFRADSIDGQLIGSFELPSSGSWPTFIDAEFDITPINGMHDIYVLFKGSWVSLNWFSFS